MKKNKTISVVITSCGRLEYLKKTMESFLIYNNYPISEYLIIEDGQDTETINYIKSLNIFSRIIINQKNLGQATSLNKIYQYVTGKYVLHLEDDWEFNKKGNFIEQSIDALNSINQIKQVWLRDCKHNNKSHYLFVKELLKTKSKYTVQVLHNKKNYKLHGFTFNPNIMRYNDFIKLYPFQPKATEIKAGRKFYDLGFYGAALDKGYCKHIGEISAFDIQKSQR